VNWEVEKAGQCMRRRNSSRLCDKAVSKAWKVLRKKVIHPRPCGPRFTTSDVSRYDNESIWIHKKGLLGRHDAHCSRYIGTNFIVSSHVSINPEMGRVFVLQPCT
jgi:hypothetical protein